jgi:hypothetical protein
MERALRQGRGRRFVLAGGLIFGGVLPVLMLLALAAHTNADGGKVCMPWDRVPLEVLSTPSGAKVFVDGRPVGRTPVAGAEACRGRRGHVRVTLPGYRSWEWTGFVSGKSISLEAQLLAEPQAGLSVVVPR